MFKRETYAPPKGSNENTNDYKKYVEKYDKTNNVCQGVQTFPYKTIQTYKTPPSKLNYTGVL
jgi:hypothetical protein